MDIEMKKVPGRIKVMEHLATSTEYYITWFNIIKHSMELKNIKNFCFHGQKNVLKDAPVIAVLFSLAHSTFKINKKPFKLFLFFTSRITRSVLFNNNSIQSGGT